MLSNNWFKRYSNDEFLVGERYGGELLGEFIIDLNKYMALNMDNPHIYQDIKKEIIRIAKYWDSFHDKVFNEADSKAELIGKGSINTCYRLNDQVFKIRRLTFGDTGNILTILSDFEEIMLANCVLQDMYRTKLVGIGKQKDNLYMILMQRYIDNETMTYKKNSDATRRRHLKNLAKKLDGQVIQSEDKKKCDIVTQNYEILDNIITSNDENKDLNVIYDYKSKGLLYMDVKIRYNINSEYGKVRLSAPFGYFRDEST